jgi:RsiW-degrading membrane proteinase PrsW (M82 family)
MSFAPVLAAALYLCRRSGGFSPFLALLFIAGGLLALLFAAFLQSALPPLGIGVYAPLADMILRVVLTEETSRALILGLFFVVLPRFYSGARFERAAGAGAGLLSGLAFAALETALHAAAESNIALIRALTAAPLHGACGIRCALAVYAPRKEPLKAAMSFLSAVILHSVYNLMLTRGGLLPALSVLLAVTSLVSAMRHIRE